MNSKIELRNAIKVLEIQQSEAEKQLKEQFHVIYDSFQPINILKNTLKEVKDSHEIKDEVIGVSAGLVLDYLSNIFYKKESRSPFRKLLGTALVLGITTFVAKNPEIVQFVIKKVWHFFSPPSDEEDDIF